MKGVLFFVFTCIIIASCNDRKPSVNADSIIASGQMPDVVKDNSDNLHLVYGTGDSIMYSHSSDDGITFSASSLISVLPKLAASHTRGPQVAATNDGLVLTACNDSGDIFTYVKDASGKWQQTARVNDMDTVAKENLMSLSADGQNAFAVWLDLRDKHNKIFGAKSTDGGKTWGKNIMIYASPDTTVCECCKPSVGMKGNNIYVMFRNWLNGNRDLHIIQSTDGGLNFGQAQKLGTGRSLSF
jgi:Neuraminidase (sialidase)